MKSSAKKKNVSLVWLKEHPRQHEFFSETTDSELQELATDMHSRGLQEPIHCCPDGTIIRGHRRVAAAKKLGWKTIAAFIREDLGDATSPEVVNELVTDNVMRRSSDDLELARCYRYLKQAHEVEKSGECGDARDRLAARLKCGKSGRTLDRLERLLDLPRDVQEMISVRRLNKLQAEKILRLPAQLQEALFEALRRGESVTIVLRKFEKCKPHHKKMARELGQELLTFLKTHLSTMKQNLEELDQLQLRGADVNDVIALAADFLADWGNRKRSLGQQDIKNMKTRLNTHPESGQTDQFNG